jgi:putative ABC transport system ATP-binding protein
MSANGAAGDIILRTQALRRVIAGGKVLVDGISVDVVRSEVLAILGPSGSGKSSFLRLLNRLDEPTSGTVLLDGVDYKTIAPRVLRRRIGMVLQAPSLFPGTVAENVSFGPRAHDEQVSGERVEQLLARVDLRGYSDRDVASLSGGEAQRVSLARTLMNEPEVLLLDEPTSALDQAAERHVESLITDVVRERGLTTLIVTHDVPQAERLADRVMIVEAGKMTRIGAVGEVMRHAA